MDFLQPNSSTTITLLVVIFLISYYYLSHKVRALRGQHPPVAAGAWPVIGHLPKLAGSQLPHIVLGAMADKYGPLFTIRVGFHSALVVSTSEIAKELFTTYDSAIISRPRMTAVKLLGYNHAMFGFSSDAAYWRQIRKIATQELLSNRRLDQLKHIWVYEEAASIKELHRFWTKSKKNELGQVLVEMKQWFGDLTLNVMVRMVAGKRYSGASCEAYEKESRKCQKALRELMHFLGLFVMRDAVPFLGWLYLGGHENAMKKTAKELDGILGEWVEEHKRKRNSGQVEGEQDFMGIMLKVLYGANIGGFDADTVNKATCMNLIAGGSDTTAVTLIWALSLLLNNHDVLRKAQEELDIHIGKERLVNESDISKLVYLNAIVKETLRLYPPAFLTGIRQFSENCKVSGYHIPKGTRLMINLWKIQRDPRVWSDPLEFKPERFLTAYKDIDVRGQHFELSPFGNGRRACPGTSFALQMLHLILAIFLHAFRISTPSNAPVDMTQSVGLTNIKATPLEILVLPRLSSEVYE